MQPNDTHPYLESKNFLEENKSECTAFDMTTIDYSSEDDSEQRNQTVYSDQESVYTTMTSQSFVSLLTVHSKNPKQRTN